MSFAQKALDDGNAGHGYVFAVGLDPYTELKLPNDDANFVEIEAARRALKHLATAMQTLREQQNDIDFVLGHQAWFEFDEGGVAALNAINKEISNELNVIRDKARVCSTDFSACEDYSPTIPELNLPARKEVVPPDQIPETRPEAKPDIGQLSKEERMRIRALTDTGSPLISEDLIRKGEQ